MEGAGQTHPGLDVNETFSFSVAARQSSGGSGTSGGGNWSRLNPESFTSAWGGGGGASQTLGTTSGGESRGAGFSVEVLTVQSQVVRKVAARRRRRRCSEGRVLLSGGGLGGVADRLAISFGADDFILEERTGY